MSNMPVISVPVTMAEKVKAHGNLSYKPAEIKQIMDAVFNCFLDEVAKGNSVSVPKMFKFTRELLKAREFRIPGSADPDATTSKPARFSFKATISAATKDAFEAIKVKDASDDISEEDAAEEVVEPEPVKPKGKSAKAPKADKAVDNAPKAEKPAKAKVAKAASEIEPVVEKPKSKAKASSSKGKSKKSGGSSDEAMQLEPEGYNDIDDGEFSDGV